MIGVKVHPADFFLADDMRLWTAGLFAFAIFVTIITVVSAYKDYKVAHDPIFGLDEATQLTTTMVLRQEILMLLACIFLLAASILRIAAAAPEPGLSVAQSALYCVAAVVMVVKSVWVNRSRAKILAVAEWTGQERRKEPLTEPAPLLEEDQL